MSRQTLLYQKDMIRKLIECFDDYPMINGKDEITRHNYIRYRLGRLKHEFWLKNRKNKKKIYVEEYDWFILNNLKSGNTCMFGSAGYYLEELIENLTVVETWNVVKGFYPKAHIVKHRRELEKLFPEKFDNFVVNNNRGDHWTVNAPTEHMIEYIKTMNDGALLFYSFRDTQTIFNRFVNQYEHFLNWAKSLEKICDLHLIWHDIKFAEKQKISDDIEFDIMENPDTSNGNLKFVFQYNRNDYKLDMSYYNG